MMGEGNGGEYAQLSILGLLGQSTKPDDEGAAQPANHVLGITPWSHNARETFLIA